MKLFKRKSNTVYVVNMVRWGSRENHGYTLSAHTTIQKAYEAGEREAIDRGGKYEYEIIELQLDQKKGYEKYLKSVEMPCSKKCKNDCRLKEIFEVCK